MVAGVDWQMVAIPVAGAMVGLALVLTAIRGGPRRQPPIASGPPVSIAPTDPISIIDVGPIPQALTVTVTGYDVSTAERVPLHVFDSPTSPMSRPPDAVLPSPSRLIDEPPAVAIDSAALPEIEVPPNMGFGPGLGIDDVADFDPMPLAAPSSPGGPPVSIPSSEPIAIIDLGPLPQPMTYTVTALG